MIQMRSATPQDVPRQRELWTLAFGDGGDYLDNFYACCPAPARVLVLLEDGVVQAMTAWFPTTLVIPGGERWNAAYLYAVCTHPDARGRGHAGALLKYCDYYLKEEQGFQAVTTVPAQPSLHQFFGGNGFRECFTLDQCVIRAEELTPSGTPALERIGAQEYGALREALLEGTAHIAYPADSLAYQEGACRLSGGGLFRGQTQAGPVCLCAEGDGGGAFWIKELLGAPQARKLCLPALAQTLPAPSWTVRYPGSGVPFGMLKWLWPGLEQRWEWNSTAYLGLAFD